MPLQRLSALAARPAAALIVAAASLAACDSPAEPTPTWADDPQRPAGQRVISIAGAGATTCAQLDTGSLMCWGENRWGEIGDGTRTPSAVAKPGAGGMIFDRIFGGGMMCGVTRTDQALCWGYNPAARFTGGIQEFFPTPTSVPGDHRFRALASSGHVCGVDFEGQAFCWGSELGGQLGGGDRAGNQTAPARVASPYLYQAITTATQISCALRISGEADCWGWGVGMGSGPGDRSVAYPTPVSGGRRYTRISAGDETVCALDTSGVPYCWGKAGRWWPEDFRPAPEKVPTDLRFVEVATGGSRFGACALTAEGEAHCWAGREAPSPVPGRHRWAGIAAVGVGFCGYTPGGSAYCWYWDPVNVNGETRWVIGVPEPIPPFAG